MDQDHFAPRCPTSSSALHPRRAFPVAAALLAPLFVLLGGACSSGGHGPTPYHPDAGRDAATPVVDGGGPTDSGGLDAGPGPDAGPCTVDGDCDDGTVCNGVETCAGGACVPGELVDCDDLVDCTTDACNEPAGDCSHVAADTACAAGEVCDLTLGCRPATLCSVDGDCDDGAACNGAETCAPGAPGADAMTGCVAGTAVDCDDGTACSIDACVEPAGDCTHTAPDMDMDGAGALGCLAGTDCNDGDAMVHPGATEACNGVDDNCSGAVDDGAGMDCAMGSSPASCTTACGTSGTSACSATCTRAGCVGPEVCNGCDDNGNGSVDEGFACAMGSPPAACVTSCGTPGTSACTAMCSRGGCAGPEVCNGCDDNGNGSIDESFACAMGSSSACTTSCGTAGTQACAADCSAYSACTAAEVCNGCDDDADGTCDNGFACCAGTSSACTVGSCSGTRTCTSSCTAGTCNLGPAPPSSTCAGTLTTIRATGTFTYSTCGASSDYAASCGGGAGSPDLVYRLVITSRSTVVLETTAASYDTVLHLHSGSCPGPELACDDDGGAGTLSRISRTLNPGTYWVIVDGFATGRMGTGTLRATVTVVRPANNTCATATALSLLAGRTTVTGSTAAATNQAGSCRSAPDVWYRFTLPAREVVRIDTFGSRYDTYLGLRSGSCGAANLGCTDDACGSLQSQIVRTLAAGTYYVQIDGFATTSSGAFTLNIEHLPVGNDPVARALPAGASTQIGATAGAGVVNGSCRTGTAPEDMYYWTQCPSATGGAFSGSTCHASTNYDTVAYIRSGVTGADLACNDDAACSFSGLRSTVTATVPAGAGLFGFYVDGYSANSGRYGAVITRP